VSDPPVIIDAGPLVALLSQKDAYHDWASETARALPNPFLSSEPAFTEACLLLQRENLPLDSLFALLEEQALLLAFDVQSESTALASLIRKFSSLPKGARMSLADASLVRLSEIHDRAAVFTLDRHFTIYRKHGRRQIRLIAPWASSDK